jgi:UDP-3-O-[3-hydroxymyristoyl] glucosamine N-acyltransferase
MKTSAYRVRDLARVAQGTVVGDGSITVDGFSSIEEASSGDVVYAENAKALGAALQSGAGCIVAKDVDTTDGRVFIAVDNPRLAFARIVHHMAPPSLPAPGVHAAAVVAETAELGPRVHVGPFVVIEDDASLGEGSVVLAGSYVGNGCTLGKNCVIGPHVVLYPGVHLGDRVRVHSGTVVGSDGFGYVIDEQSGSYFKIPQLGTVVVEDDVEIGSNTSIDRATFGSTTIGKDTKVDNLIQIAHNVQIGAHCTLSGQAGIAGSSTLGDYCVLAGQVGIADHVVLEDRVIVGAQAGVPSKKRIKGNQIIWGSPARPLAEAMKMFSTLALLAKEKDRGRKKEKKG